MKKALRIVGNILTALILIFALFVMIFTVVSVNTVNREEASIFGYKPYIVLSDSMQDTFEVGDMVISKSVDVSTLEPGDIITFSSIDRANYGETVTHKIREITTYEGEPAFVTYGTTTGVDDAYPVPFANVTGEYQFRLPGMGYFFEFLRTPAGYVTLILIPFLLLIILQAIKFFRLARQYKAEQKAEIMAEKAAVEAERLKAQQMLEELERLRAQMAETAAMKDTNESAEVLDESGEE
ncbi:MAG TPA: signal peptidase I [Firmicutes bacterium]|nr:signal peptidase I [Bacillota bacterium]